LLNCIAAAAAAPKTPTLSTRGIVRRATSLLSTGSRARADVLGSTREKDADDDAAAAADGDATTP